MQSQRSRIYNALEIVLKRGPITLAQIPDAIKKQCDLDVDLKKLGHNKLKDYVMADQRFYVYSKGANFPAVDLKSREHLTALSNSPDINRKKQYSARSKDTLSSVYNFNKTPEDSPEHNNHNSSTYWQQVSEEHQMSLQQRITDILTQCKDRNILGGIAFDELILSLQNSGYEYDKDDIRHFMLTRMGE